MLATGLAIGLFLVAWGTLHHGFYRHDQIPDTPIYQRYGDAIANGKVPYRDFALEYPPAALPVFALPSLLRSDDGDLAEYERGFEAEMVVCGAFALIFMLWILVRLAAGPSRLAVALGFAAVAPLLLGSVVLSRFDLWPAALTTGALAAVAAGRNRLGAGALGLAAAAKLYPAALLPLALAWAWKRSGRREAATSLGAFAVVASACFVPFLVLAPGGLYDALTRQTSRPLQVESLGAGFLLVAHAVAGVEVTTRSGHGSQNLVGTLPDRLAAVQTVLQLALLLGIWVWFARGPAEQDRLVRGWAGTVGAFLALGKVLSPQFLLWLVPLVPLVRGRRGIVAGFLLAVALVLTQLWFPFRYWDLALHFDELSSWLVLLRDLVLVALFAALVVPTGAERAASRSP